MEAAFTEALTAIGLIVAATATVYRLSLLPVQKILAGWVERTEQGLTVVTQDGEDWVVTHPKRVRWFAFEAVTCPECFGIWLTFAVWTAVMVIYSPYTDLPLITQILGYPIVAAWQQKEVARYE